MAAFWWPFGGDQLVYIQGLFMAESFFNLSRNMAEF